MRGGVLISGRGWCQVRWLLTRLGRRLGGYWSALRVERAPRQLRVRETLPIGEKRQLLVVDVRGRQFLIGAAGNCLTMLAELSRPATGEQAWHA